MARRRKKRGGGSSEGKSMIDRISDLPDEVMHHILSFLTVIKLVRVCCVSKRWRQLSLSAPVLNFDEFPPLYSRFSCAYRLEVMTFLERFLFHRGDNKIHTFCVYWERHYTDENENECFCFGERYRLNTWINLAVGCNVEVLHIKMSLNDPKEASLPYSVFLCGTLRSLTVNFALVGTPSFGFSSNLSKLELDDVVIENDQFFKWISCCCKFIEEFTLSQVLGVNSVKSISIESSSLKILRFFYVSKTSHLSISGEKLEHLVVVWAVESPSNSSMNICAPNLKRLHWFGRLTNRLTLGKFRCLEAADLGLIPSANESDKVYEVLRSLCKVRTLSLKEATIKVPFSEESLQTPLNDIHFLDIYIGRFTDELIPAVVSLLRGMP